MKKMIVFILFALLQFNTACATASTTNSEDIVENESKDALENKEMENEETSNIEKYDLGTKVSTDIMELTINSACFSFYASSKDDEHYGDPTDSDDYYMSKKGSTLVPMTITIKNIDRGELNTMDYRNNKWAIVYNGERKTLHNFCDEYNDDPFCMYFAYIGEAIDDIHGTESHNHIFKPDETLIVKKVGLIEGEPNDLKDGFDIIVNLPNSNGQFEEFVYEVK